MSKAAWEKLASDLQGESSARCVDVIKSVAKTQPRVAGLAIERCHVDRSGLHNLLIYAVENVNLEVLKYWVHGIAQRAGFRRILRWLSELEDLDSDVARFSEYYLRAIVPDTARDRAALARFARTLK